MPKQFQNILITLILTAGGGTWLFSSLLANKTECEATRTVLVREMNEETLTPVRAVQLMATKEYGCGLLSDDLSVETEAQIDQLRTDGYVFLYYSDEDYQARKTYLFEKRQNRRAGEPDYENYEEFAETIAIANYVMIEPVRIENVNLNELDKQTIENIVE